MASISSRVVAAAAIIGLSACGKKVEDRTAVAPALHPMTFFIGRTHGDGELAKLFSRPLKMSVDSVGRKQGDILVLDQTIHEGSTPPRVRQWTMRPVAANRYSGSMTDAVGQVNVIVSGSRADIHYKTKAGFEVAQQLVLQSDGKTILNRLSVRKLGIRVATVRETIRKLS